MFRVNSELKMKFIFAHGLDTEEEMRANSQLTYHASGIIGAIDRMAKSLESVNSNEYAEIELRP
jgi:hypothetical protein